MSSSRRCETETCGLLPAVRGRILESVVPSAEFPIQSTEKTMRAVRFRRTIFPQFIYKCNKYAPRRLLAAYIRKQLHNFKYRRFNVAKSNPAVVRPRPLAAFTILPSPKSPPRRGLRSLRSEYSPLYNCNHFSVGMVIVPRWRRSRLWHPSAAPPLGNILARASSR